ncbi:hypothetical protein LTR66_013777, partial [Elasticomyces elasticus]
DQPVSTYKQVDMDPTTSATIDYDTASLSTTVCNDTDDDYDDGSLYYDDGDDNSSLHDDNDDNSSLYDDDDDYEYQPLRYEPLRREDFERFCLYYWSHWLQPPYQLIARPCRLIFTWLRTQLRPWTRRDQDQEASTRPAPLVAATADRTGQHEPRRARWWRTDADDAGKRGEREEEKERSDSVVANATGAALRCAGGTVTPPSAADPAWVATAEHWRRNVAVARRRLELVRQSAKEGASDRV